MTEQVYSASRKGVSSSDTQNNKLSFFSIFGGIISLNLILWAGFWAYNLISRDINGIPIVAAQPGPLRVAPEVPGGIEAENIELAVSKIASQEAYVNVLGHAPPGPPSQRLARLQCYLPPPRTALQCALVRTATGRDIKRRPRLLVQSRSEAALVREHRGLRPPRRRPLRRNP